MARIALISTGGTFANEGTGERDYLTYLDSGRVLGVDELLEFMPDLDGLARIEPIPFGTLRSKEVGPVEWARMHGAVTAALAEGVDGVILTHGTGLAEETAFYLHLTLATDRPVVVVGAQRPPSTVSSDAQKNLLDAVHWIRSPKSTGCGVVVVMDQTVHSARDVQKLANHTLSAMGSPVFGPLGRINVDGSVTLAGGPAAGRSDAGGFASLGAAGEFPRVDIVHQYAGADATQIDACVRAGAKGVVVVGFPPGTNTPALDEAIERHSEAGVVIVQASRALRDPRILQRDGLAGVVRNGDLSPQHARILLGLCLAHGYELAQIQQEFDRH